MKNATISRTSVQDVTHLTNLFQGVQFELKLDEPNQSKEISIIFKCESIEQLQQLIKKNQPNHSAYANFTKLELSMGIAWNYNGKTGSIFDNSSIVVKQIEGLFETLQGNKQELSELYRKLCFSLDSIIKEEAHVITKDADGTYSFVNVEEDIKKNFLNNETIHLLQELRSKSLQRFESAVTRAAKLAAVDPINTNTSTIPKTIDISGYLYNPSLLVLPSIKEIPEEGNNNNNQNVSQVSKELSPQIRDIRQLDAHNVSHLTDLFQGLQFKTFTDKHGVRQLGIAFKCKDQQQFKLVTSKIPPYVFTYYDDSQLEAIIPLAWSDQYQNYSIIKEWKPLFSCLEDLFTTLTGKPELISQLFLNLIEDIEMITQNENEFFADVGKTFLNEIARIESFGLYAKHSDDEEELAEEIVLSADEFQEQQFDSYYPQSDTLSAEGVILSPDEFQEEQFDEVREEIIKESYVSILAVSKKLDNESVFEKSENNNNVSKDVPKDLIAQYKNAVIIKTALSHPKRNTPVAIMEKADTALFLLGRKLKDMGLNPDEIAYSTAQQHKL